MRKRRVIVWLLAACLCLPAPLAAAEGQPAPPVAPPAADVAMTAGGLLTGQVVTPSGRPLAGAPVWLHTLSEASVGDAPIQAFTNERGQFAYRGAQQGVYCLQAGESLRTARVWRSDAAPPAAQSGLLVVASSDAVRAQSQPPKAVQRFVSNSKRLMANPLVVATVVGAAVAIPVAIHNDDSGS